LLLIKGGFKSKNVEEFLNLQTHMPIYYLKLLHPVHGNEKMLILEFFAFTGLVYRKVASSNTSRFEANAGLFRLSMKGILDAYVL
jgi:hypothetical protein